MDLISANDFVATLTVLTSSGSGGLVLASSPAVGDAPVSVAAADVNGDGKLDLISANEGANTLTVLFNVPTFNGGFTGDGGGLTDLNATNVTGVLGTAQIPNLGASRITSGTLSDARLSGNVALRAGGNAFTGDQTVTNGNVGIGTTLPESELHIFRGSYGGPTASPSSLLTLENNNTAIIQMLTPATNFSGIVFGTPTDSLDASMRYNNLSDRELSFRTLNTVRMVITTNGSVGIGITAPGNRLHVNGGITCTALTQTSDRNAKENFAPISPVEVLNKVAALPITTWNFKELHDGRHIGPMAQDF